MLLTVVVAAILCFAASDVAAEYFTINRFHADINVHEDGSFVVTETIEVTFHRQRHGIYREIPYQYKDELGGTIRTPIDVMGVTNQSGKEWDYKVSRQGSVVNIRIGHPDVYVNGRQSYVITYRVKNGLLFFEDHDELYWNVTGNYWDAEIESASATINLVTDKKTQQQLTGCYTGRYGQNESACVYEIHENSVSFKTTRPFGAREGLTVAFGWDKGLVRPPSALERFVYKYNLRQNWVFMVPVIVLIFMLFHWRRRGKDPRVREAVTVMYEPPKHNGKPLSAAEVGSLIDERFDPRDLTASIVGLAVKGYLRIEEIKIEGFLSLFKSVDYDLIKLKEADAGLDQFEQTLFNDLFEAGAGAVKVSYLKNRFYKNLKSLRDSLWSGLKQKKYFAMSPPTVRGSYMGIGVVFIVFGILGAVIFDPDYSVRGIIAAVFSGVIVMAFAGAMPVKTRLGAAAYMEVVGFQEFMNRADKDRIERMGKDIFYKYMPYAIALDVVDHWAEAFEGIFNEPPNWYVASGGFRTFSPVAFTHSMGAVTGSLSSATFSRPRSSGTSGGGGGGSSGGGGGGGGGGSW